MNIYKKGSLLSLISLVLMFFIVYSYSNAYLLHVISQLSSAGIRVLTLFPFESIYTRFYISSVFTITVTSPFIISFIYCYLSSALYPHEKNILKKTVLPISYVFTIGFIFGSMVIPEFLNYFIISQSVLGANTTVSLSKYISFICGIGTICGILLCYPLAIYTLFTLHIISEKLLTQYRKHAIVIAFIAGAILTPPDVITQMCVAFPLIILHEIAIMAIKIKEGLVWKQTKK